LTIVDLDFPACQSTSRNIKTAIIQQLLFFQDALPGVKMPNPRLRNTARDVVGSSEEIVDIEPSIYLQSTGHSNPAT
jgi:hypothetical protein